MQLIIVASHANPLAWDKWILVQGHGAPGSPGPARVTPRSAGFSRTHECESLCKGQAHEVFQGLQVMNPRVRQAAASAEAVRVYKLLYECPGHGFPAGD